MRWSHHNSLAVDDKVLRHGKRQVLIAEGIVPVSAPLAFTANDCHRHRHCTRIARGALDYYDKAPFRFNGTIERVYVKYVGT